MIGDPGNPNDRGYAGTAGEPYLGFQNVDADAAMLHVEMMKSPPRIGGDPAETGGKNSAAMTP